MSKSILHWLTSLDRVLRGETTQLPALREGTVSIPLIGLSFVSGVLAMLYGTCMGCFALLREQGPVYEQVVASTVKVPALFFCTLAVTFPSLYVFNALVGCRLSLPAILKLLVAALAVNVAVLSSLGPVVAFFSVSTTSYHFMILLNLVVFAVSGVLGLSFLLQTLHRLSLLDGTPSWPPRVEPVSQPPTEPPAAGEATTATTVDPDVALLAPAEPSQPLIEATPTAREVYEPGALDRVQGQMLGRHVKTVFRCWMVVFGLVGLQMSWLLRPFIGAPTLEFEWLRPRGGNVFEAVWRTVSHLLSL